MDDFDSDQFSRGHSCGDDDFLRGGRHPRAEMPGKRGEATLIRADNEAAVVWIISRCAVRGERSKHESGHWGKSSGNTAPTRAGDSVGHEQPGGGRGGEGVVLAEHDQPGGRPRFMLHGGGGA